MTTNPASPVDHRAELRLAVAHLEAERQVALTASIVALAEGLDGIEKAYRTRRDLGAVPSAIDRAAARREAARTMLRAWEDVERQFADRATDAANDFLDATASKIRAEAGDQSRDRP
jgi:hypothetical protein